MFAKLKYYIITVFIILSIIAGILIPKTNVNYNALEYLPKNSETKIAYEVLKKEFGESGSLLVLVEEVDEATILALNNQLKVDGVQNIEYETSGDKVLFNLVLSHDDYSKEARVIIEEIISILDTHNYRYYLNGQSYLTYYFNKTINEQILKIILLLFPLILLILFVTSQSYFEPVLFVIVIGISVLLNMGTNALLNSVSYMTHSIAAVIQIAVVMDYSIILLHTYQTIKEKESDSKKAIQIAWKISFIPIVSSALTTVAGFVAIMFMRYQIGLDIGLVLAKGVIISLITILLLLPCLILVFDKVIMKTMHKNWFVKVRSVKKLNSKWRLAIPIITVALIISAFIIQNNNEFLYSDNTTARDIEEISESNEKMNTYFGYRMQAVILLDKDFDATSLITKLEEVKYENKSYIENIIGLDKKLNVNDLYLLTQKKISIEDINKIMLLLNKNEITLKELINLTKPMKQSQMQQVLSFVSDDDISILYLLAQKESLTLFEVFGIINEPYSLNDLIVLLPEDQLQVIFGQSGKDKMSLIEVVTFFDNYVNTKYDANMLVAIFQNVISIDDINKVMLSLSTDKLSINEFISLMLKDFNKEEIKFFLADMDENFIDAVYLDMKSKSLLTDDKTTIKVFLGYILENYRPMLTEGEIASLEGMILKMVMLEEMVKQSEQLAASKTMLDSFKQINPSLLGFDISLITNAFISSNYQRLVLTIDLPEESELSFAYYEALEKEVKETGAKYYFISRTTSVMEIKDTSKNDYLLATIISIGMIFIIIFLSFKSLTIPVILVLLIQGAVFINMAIPALIGEDLIFIGYIIVSCIQLGATIDYAILSTHRYVHKRKSYDKERSLSEANYESTSSIITSGLIFTLAGLSLAFFSPIPVIRSMGRLIGIGAAISMIMVILLLPQILYLTDKFIVKIKKN